MNKYKKTIVEVHMLNPWGGNRIILYEFIPGHHSHEMRSLSLRADTERWRRERHYWTLDKLLKSLRGRDSWAKVIGIYEQAFNLYL